MLRRGFALLEVLLVIAILGMISGVSVPMYRDFQIRSDLDSSTEQVTQGLAKARLMAQSGEQDSAWGFYIPAGVLYKGESYAARDPQYDEVYPMPSTITPTGPTEVSYSKLVGAPSATGSITLSTINTEQRTILIEVKQESLAVVQGDRITVCHNAGTESAHTLTIPDAAWPAHQGHGDTYGACPGSSSSSASVASSAASSVVSSAASSVASSVAASSSSAAAGCADRFSVASNGKITTTGTLTATYTVLGSEITYGAGGPDIAVTAEYNKTPSNSWPDLFGGAAINGNGGQTTTVTGLTNGSKLTTRFRAYYKKKGWLTYDETYATDDGSGHIKILRNGDTPPSTSGYGGQGSAKNFLAPILNAQGKISIGTYDVVLLAELGQSTTGSSADFQDAVVKISFSQPSSCN